MPKFLIDVNLPRYLAVWDTMDYIHQADINDEWKDSKIWEYAKANNLTIITKDSDFADLILFREPPPKVIHIRFGNMKMRDFFTAIQLHWEDVLLLNQNHKLITLFKDRIEAIN